MKKDTDYHVEKTTEEITFIFDNPNRIATGLTLSHSHRITLPTRTVENVLEVGFTTLETIYFYAMGKLTVKLEKTGNISNKDRRDR